MCAALGVGLWNLDEDARRVAIVFFLLPSTFGIVGGTISAFYESPLFWDVALGMTFFSIQSTLAYSPFIRYTFLFRKVDTLTVGDHSLIDSYAGDHKFATSESAIRVQRVARSGVSMNLTSSPNPSSVGQSVTFTSAVLGTLTVPTGSVTFK
jgi:hypothetical protein